jgi:hypothetical protein
MRFSRNDPTSSNISLHKLQYRTLGVSLFSTQNQDSTSCQNAKLVIFSLFRYIKPYTVFQTETYWCKFFTLYPHMAMLVLGGSYILQVENQIPFGNWNDYKIPRKSLEVK